MNKTADISLGGISLHGLRGQMLLDEPMSRHTSWRVGGVADYFYKPADIEDVSELMQQLPDTMPVFWLGLGSNILVRDAGIRGLVILTSGLLNNLVLLEKNTLRAEAGVACAKVARIGARNHLVGAEFLAGIPGTMGGALAMNAGAFGGETWERVVNVETLDQHGARHIRTPDEYVIGYRSVQGPADEWFIATTLQLEPGDSDAAQKRIKELLATRSATQPTQMPSCGSVFRNPEGHYSAVLIEQAGLKGKQIGNACVSEKHANFIVNLGGATAQDIESLITLVHDTVLQQTGVDLIREVRIVGESVEAGL